MIPPARQALAQALKNALSVLLPVRLLALFPIALGYSLTSCKKAESKRPESVASPGQQSPAIDQGSTLDPDSACVLTVTAHLRVKDNPNAADAGIQPPMLPLASRKEYLAENSQTGSETADDLNGVTFTELRSDKASNAYESVCILLSQSVIDFVDGYRFDDKYHSLSSPEGWIELPTKSIQPYSLPWPERCGKGQTLSVWGPHVEPIYYFGHLPDPVTIRWEASKKSYVFADGEYAGLTFEDSQFQEKVDAYLKRCRQEIEESNKAIQDSQ